MAKKSAKTAGLKAAGKELKADYEKGYKAGIEFQKKIEQKAEEYREKLANPFIAGSRGFIDDVIMPNTTRKRICRSLEMLKNKKLSNPWKKHDNIPL